MSEGLETKILQLFTDKMDEIRETFEQEAIKRRKMTTAFLLSFGVAILIFVFSAGKIVQKVNSLEENYYKVAEKVEILYMAAVSNGDIEFNTRGLEKN